mgnify:CR=1 FL=1
MPKKKSLKRTIVRSGSVEKRKIISNTSPIFRNRLGNRKNRSPAYRLADTGTRVNRKVNESDEPVDTDFTVISIVICPLVLF